MTQIECRRVDPDEMQHYAAFRLGHQFVKVSVYGFQVYKIASKLLKIFRKHMCITLCNVGYFHLI